MNKKLNSLLFLTITLATSITHAMQQSRTIKLIAADQSFEVLHDIAMQMVTIKEIIEDTGDRQELELSSEISPNLMKYILHIIQLFYGYQKYSKLANRALLDAVEKDLNLSELPLFELLFAFNHLNFQSGIELIARAIARDDNLCSLFVAKHPPADTDENTYKQFALAQKLKDLRPMVARFYYIRINEGGIITPTSKLQGVDPESYGISFQDGLDYNNGSLLLNVMNEGYFYLRKIVSLHGLTRYLHYFRRLSVPSLDIADNQIQEIPKGIFKGLTQLQELHLQNNKIQEIPVGALQDLPRLRELDLSNNKIREIPIDVLKGLPHLTRVNLSSNMISEENIDQLRKAFPEVNFSF